tara:strand:- start:769 stop:2013 length:1245 start_codon:yes stop_codon:yes gene_type:complete
MVFSNPFVVSFDIGNFKYSITSNVFIGVLSIVLFIFYLLIYLFFKSRLALNKFLLGSKYRRIDRGYNYFVQAMIAIANKDKKTATMSHKKMQNYLKNEKSLSLLLKSEVFKIEKKYSELINVYEDMLKSNETVALGYRGLMEMNLNNQDFHHAFLYGEKLFSLNPNIDKLYETLIFIAAKTKNWNQIIIISDKAYSRKIVNKDILNLNKSIAYYEIAKIKLDSDYKEAQKNIIKAMDLRKSFVPYIKIYLEILKKHNNLSLLKRNIKKFWYITPNSMLRKILVQVIVDSKLDSLEFIYQVIKNNYDDPESKKLLIFFAIRNQNWNVARDKITGLIGENPTKEICIFMSEIEIGEKNDKQKSDAWLMRSQNATLETKWICSITNQIYEDWQPISNSGHFNSLVLYNPKMLNKITY